MASREKPRRVPSAAHWGLFEVEVRGDRVLGIHPERGDPHPSPILRSIPGMARHRTRIARPMVREGWLRRPPGDGAEGGGGEGRGRDRFVPVSWERALELVAREIERIRAEHGNEAIFGGSYGWGSAGRFHHAQSQVHRFLNAAGGYVRSVDTYSTAALSVTLPHLLASREYVYRHATAWPVIAEQAELIVAFGGIPLANSQVNAGGVGRHRVRAALERCRARGVPLVSVSPVREDEAPAWAAPGGSDRALELEWLPLRPGTDTAVLLALAHTLIESGRADEAFLRTHCIGYEAVRAHLGGAHDGVVKDAQWAARISGLEAGAIRALAGRMAQRRTFLTLSWSIQRTHRGEQACWAGVLLAAVLGQIGLPGGGIGFGFGAVDGMGSPVGSYALPTLPQGTNPVERFIPVARIADCLLRPGEPFEYDGHRLPYPRLRMLYWAGGNPFHHHQDLNRLVQAWRRPETIVVHEPWWTPAARHADIVLPATTTLERNDIGAGRLDDHLVAMRRALPPHAQARDDYAIFRDLAARLGVEERFAEGRDEQEWLRHLWEVARQQNAAQGIEMPDFESFWASGRFVFPEGEGDRVFLSDFRADPGRHPLSTPSGRIELFSEAVASFGYEDCPGYPTWLEPCEWLGSERAGRYPLHLVSSQPPSRLHSQLDPGQTSLETKIRGREPVRVHPEDARRRGIREGDVVRIFNDRGACLAGVRVTDAVRPGVVVLATGAWYDPAPPGAVPEGSGGPGPLCVHGNPNVLTPDVGTSRLAQGPSAHTCLVEIERWTHELPPVRAHDPPPVAPPEAGPGSPRALREAGGGP